MARDGTVTLVGGKIYPSPSAAPIQNGVLLVRNGIITALGIRETVTIPPNTEILDCTNRVVTAAFWNSHVHFTESKWYPADKLTTAQLAANLRDMLTGYAFVRVLDTGSDLKNTLMIRSRIETGELRGPFIATTGPGFVPANGSPFYSLPLRLPELLTSADAAKLVKGRIQEGADAVKLFTSSWASERKIEVMLPEIVRSTVQAAHTRGKLVVAHASDLAGAIAAITGGVDILAHTFSDDPGSQSILLNMRDAHVALIPTLKLWKFEQLKRNPSATFDDKNPVGSNQLRAFAKVGGQILFGTDVGYMTDYDPTEEYLFMQSSGLSFRQILNSLTTAPAEKFGVASTTGAS